MWPSLAMTGSTNTWLVRGQTISLGGADIWTTSIADMPLKRTSQESQSLCCCKVIISKLPQDFRCSFSAFTRRPYCSAIHATQQLQLQCERLGHVAHIVGPSAAAAAAMSYGNPSLSECEGGVVAGLQAAYLNGRSIKAGVQHCSSLYSLHCCISVLHP